jgi:astacin (peptidase family M12A)/IPT/TIG domain-containing protein/dockerin type I repeat protein
MMRRDRKLDSNISRRGCSEWHDSGSALICSTLGKSVTIRRYFVYPSGNTGEHMRARSAHLESTAILQTTSQSQFRFFTSLILLLFVFCLALGGLAINGFAARPSGGAADSRRDTAAVPPIHHGFFRHIPVAYTVRDGKAIFQGDIILNKIDSIDPKHSQSSFGPNSVGLDYSQYLWPRVGNQYQIPYVIDPASGNLTNLNTAISQFNSTFSNIKFVARTAQTDYVNFYFDPNDNSGQGEASIGHEGGEQQVLGAGGSFNPCSVLTILHEMGHVVGLWHEQSRSDRDSYISISYTNVIKGSFFNFDQVYDNAQQTTLFDYASLMQYGAFTYSRNGGPVTETIPAGIPLSNTTGYSAADIDGIQRLYGNAPTAVTVTSNPPGLQVIVDGTTLTTPQTFNNWALNSSHTFGIPSGVQSKSGFIVGSTQPTTFYYTYGRWNDATAASHMITVLPGNGNIATPTSSPAVTTYTANFIQLVPYSTSVFPAGAGTVTPSPAPQNYPGSGLLFYTARQQATLTATPNAGQSFYDFNNAPFWLAGALGANPKTYYVPDTGLAVNTTTRFSPNPVYTVNVSPNSFSSNLYIYGDGGFSYAPKNFSAFYDSGWTPGSSHTLAVDATEYPYSFGSRYAFNAWSDGAMTASHSIVLPATSATYTANLTPQFYVADYVYETCAGSIDVSPSSPTFDGFYPSGTVLTFTQTTNPGWTFTGWQYDLSGTLNPKMLAITDEVLVTVDYNTIAAPLRLSSLSPASVLSGSPGFTLTLNGTGFTPSSLVSVNGTFPAVNYINNTQLTVTVPAAAVSQPGGFQVWVASFPDGAPCVAFAALPFNVGNRLTSVVSRMTHGGAGTFDINLPITAARGIEPRNSTSLGAGNYALVFTFADNLTSVASASVTSHDPAAGTGAVSGTSPGPSPNQYTVNLTNVSNGQYITVTLTSALDVAGRNGNVTGPQMGILIGDANGNGSVSSADVSQTKLQSGQAATGANFRTDINASGSISSTDVSMVKLRSGTALP